MLVTTLCISCAFKRDCSLFEGDPDSGKFGERFSPALLCRGNAFLSAQCQELERKGKEGECFHD